MEHEPTVTINGNEYKFNDLSDLVKEWLSLHEQAQQMAMKAKREAVIHDLALANIMEKLEAELNK
jgi:glycosyltransferase involved in cell wall biosynthesis